LTFVLIDKHGNIVDRYNTSTKDEAKHYFVGRKQLEEKAFDKLWNVISDEEHESRVRSGLYKKLKGEPNRYNKLGDGEFGDWLDMEKS